MGTGLDNTFTQMFYAFSCYGRGNDFDNVNEGETIRSSLFGNCPVLIPSFCKIKPFFNPSL